VRRLLNSRLLIAVFLASVVTTFLTIAAPAQADTGIPRVLVKGPGTTYTDAGAAALAVAAGSTATFGIKVINTDAAPQTYHLLLQSSSLPATSVLYTGGLLGTRLTPDSDGYYPLTLAPGATKQLTLKVTMPVGSAQWINQTSFVVLSETNEFLAGALLTTNVKAPAHGSSPYEIYARNGSQPFIGGSVDLQFAMAPPMGTGSAANFTVKLQNDGTTSTKIGFRLVSGFFCSEAFSVKVRDGVTDVTAAALAGSYRTPKALAPGRSRALTVTVKNLGSPATCDSSGFEVDSLTPAGDLVTYDYLIVARKAT
jgi:hypothetical protein